MRLIVIGRNPQEANIVINSQYISNYHAEIILLDNGDMFLVDKSTNGTFLNGIKLTPGKEVAVKRGDNVMFADMPLDWGLIDEVRIPKDVKQIKGIGSHYMNAINVQGPNVSRFHATIRQMADGKWYISDHSKNGTTVNGARIQKNRYVRINKGDEIACAGVPIQNPIPGSPLPWKWIGGVLAAACAVVLAVFILTGITRKWTEEKIANTYNPTVSLMMTTYHFEVTCKGLDLKSLGIPTEFYIDNDGYFCRYTGDEEMESIATGFFVGKDGYIVTNRHVARPWESTKYSTSSGAITVIERAEILYRDILADEYHNRMSRILPFISQIEVKGVVDRTVVIPNGSYIDNHNLINCHEIACSTEEEDLAIFKVRDNYVSSNVSSIPLSMISDESLALGNKVFTIGFPFGFKVQNYKNALQANFASGEVSRTNEDYKFGFTAPSYHGASGSPVFNKYGKLVGIVNSGIDSSQGFNYAIKAECLLKLLNQANITE